jgi:hypothetical protein
MLVLFGFAVGIASALLAATELRLSPRHTLMTASFRAYALFVSLVLLPVSVYFYVFHGDWFLLYAVDVRRIPSAIALLAFMGQGALGVLGFSLGAALARGQRNGFGYGIASTALVIGLGALALFRERLLVVGTFAQYRGNFGLHSYGGALMEAGLALGLLLLYGAAYLLVRIRVAGRRS